MSRILSALSRKLGDGHTDARGWTHFQCPRCSRPKLGVNLESMRFRCVRCGDFGGAISDLMTELGIRVEFEPEAPKKYRPTALPTPPGQIPGFKHFGTPTFPGSPEAIFVKDAIAYAKRRGGMSLDDMIREGWGYVDSGLYAMRIIVPIFIDGRRVNFLARSIYDFLEPKELPGETSAGWWPRSELVYGLDDVVPGAPLVLVEGMWDQKKTKSAVPGYSVVSTLGSHLSPGAAGRLLAKRPSKIIFFYDGDLAGREGVEKRRRNKQGREIVTGGIKLLRARGYRDTYVVATPEGKDPDEIPAVESAELIESAVPWYKWK